MLFSSICKFVLLFFFLTLISCNNTSRETSKASTQHPIKYPSDWPLKEIRCPPQSNASSIPPNIYAEAITGGVPYVSGGLRDSDKYWALAFNCRLSWTELVEYYEKFLSSEGYIGSERNPDTISYNQMISYHDPDHSYSVDVSHLQSKASVLNPEYDCFILSIQKWK